MAGDARRSGSRMSASGASPPTLYGIDLGIPLNERRVLIADDSAFNRKTLARFLQWAGISQVEFAQSGGEVLGKVETFNPDLLLLDTAMPQMDGIEVCKAMRRDARWRDLPILMQSALNSDQLRTVCFQAGATDIIAKPVNPGECIARVRYHLERRSLIQELRAFRERVERELLQARSMQLALVPEKSEVEALGDRHGLWIDAHFRSSDEIGGDFWTVREFDQDRVGVFVADLSGHGITAAINAFRLHTLISRLPDEELSDPASLLEELNLRLNDILPIGQFATAFYGVIDRRTESILYASAGTPNPILGGSDGFRQIDGSGMFLGAFAGASFENEEIPFPSGSSLFLYSDGLTEARDNRGRMLGEEGLIALIERTVANDRHRPLSRMIRDFTATFGDKLHDDLTSVWIARR